MSIDGRTQLAFLLGYPVEHSISPAMHQAAFAVTGLNAVYLPWSVSPAFLPDAEAMGAVNTILCREDTLVGKNTDGAGFLMSLRESVSVRRIPPCLTTRVCRPRRWSAT